MKKTLCLTLLAAFLLVSSTVYAGGYGHHGGGYRGYGGGYYGGHRGYYGGHGGYYYGGYYGGHGWNGAYYALGIATAVIGTALIVDALSQPCTTYSYAPPPPPPVYRYGHWEVQRAWIPGAAQRYWVNQYYDPNRNVWVLGHWEERPGGPGYWQETRVWVQQ
jgi:hypothetical protein